MQKYKASDIKTFEFSALEALANNLEKPAEEFSFKVFAEEKVSKTADETIRQERGFEKKNNFQINDVVRNSRGLAAQEESDYEKRVQEEVKKRLEISFKEAINEGREQGRAEGKKEVMTQLQNVVEEKVASLEKVILEVQAQSAGLLEKNRTDIQEFVKRFTKWVVLREIDSNKMYLEQLLEKLILELNARKNLNIKVGKNNFEKMPEIIAAVETKLGQLSNVRIEVVPEIHHPGIIIESENGLIDGSLENIFINIDKIFDQVLNNE